MKATYLGTTVLMFDDGKDQILFDAHLTRPSLFRYLGGRVQTDREAADGKIRLHHMDRLRAVFISHTHHDHVMDMPYIANACGAKVYGSSSALNVARGGGVPEGQLTEFKADETYEVGDFRIKVIPSLHSKPAVFNNDLGETIDAPLIQPARLRDYKEGGSFDFYVEAGGKRIMIRPSFNYIEGQMDGYRADILFLGIAGLEKADTATQEKFFDETVGKLRPELVIPIHWDNFFRPLSVPAAVMPRPAGDAGKAFFRLARYCEENDICCLVQLPGTSVSI